MLSSPHWRVVWDGHPIAYALFLKTLLPPDRFGRRGTKFVGPGPKIVLLGVNGSRLMCWHFRKRGNTGAFARCVAYHDDAKGLLPTHILDGMEWVDHWWGPLPLAMTLHPDAPRYDDIRSAFLTAGWSRAEDDQHGRIRLSHPGVFS